MQNHQVPVATPNIGDTYRLSKHLATPPPGHHRHTHAPSKQQLPATRKEKMREERFVSRETKIYKQLITITLYDKLKLKT
jgi:hypothetical protein